MMNTKTTKGEFINNGVELVKAEALRARRVWYFIQAVNAPVGSAAIMPAWQTEGSVTYGGDTIDEQTKQGRIVAKGTDEHSIELTQYYVPSDTSAKIIKRAKMSGDKVKVWRVEVDANLAVAEGDHFVYPAEFGYGLVDELELSDGDDFVEASFTLNIAGALVEGLFPLSAEELQSLEAIYAYERPGEKSGDFDNKQAAKEAVKK